MLNGLKPLAATALCLLGLTAFAQNAAAGQWVESGRKAYWKSSPYVSYEQYICNAGATWNQGYPGTCPSDASNGWTIDYMAASSLSYEQMRECDHNPNVRGSHCYAFSHSINGHANVDLMPSTCNVGDRAVLSLVSVETVDIQYEELGVDNSESAVGYICQ